MTAKSAVLPMDETREVGLAVGVSSAVTMFERLATDPNVNVEKLERLIAMQERILKHNAESAFNVAFTAMLPEIPTVIERAHTDKTAYAPLEDIIETVRPILVKHGFSLSFRTEWPDAKTVRVIGLLTHNEGHCRQSEFLSGADQTGSKNPIQALGSTVTYGKRYTAKDLLCIVTREEDDDAQAATKKEPPPSPDDHYDEWLTAITAVADEGWEKLSATWNKSKPAYRNHLTRTSLKTWQRLQERAKKVTADRAS